VGFQVEVADTAAAVLVAVDTAAVAGAGNEATSCAIWQ
jgi:hypothetical protein